MLDFKTFLRVQLVKEDRKGRKTVWRHQEEERYGGGKPWVVLPCWAISLGSAVIT